MYNITECSLNNCYSSENITWTDNLTSIRVEEFKQRPGPKLTIPGVVKEIFLFFTPTSVMSGQCTGVQQRICEIVPQATYVHCYAHCLNLVLVDTTKSVSEAAEFFSLMETLYVFLSRSVTHAIFLKKQSELHSDKPQRPLQRLSDTRWSCRYLAVDAVYSTFGAVLATLEEIVDGEDRSRATEAIGILIQVQTYKFLLSLIMFWRILSYTKSLSDQLQK